MAVKAAYELPYTGEEVQEMLEQTATNKNLIDDLAASLDDKVDKVAGKDLSTNDYTNEEKAKLSSLENGAQKNVQSDWNASSGDPYIKNKPTIPTKVSELENDRGYTSNVGTVTGIMMNGASKGTNGIVNLGTVLTQHQDISGKADRADAIGSLTLSMNDTNYQITLSGTKVDGTPFTVSNVIDLPLESVVVSGSYNKSTKEVVLTLKDGSTIDFSVADLVSGLQSEITTTNKLSADLVQNGTTNKVLTDAEKTKLANIEEGAQQNVQADWNAASGDAFIKNKPNIPQGVTVDSALSSTSENPVQNKVINSALSNKVDSANLATVATSGSYNDLSNKPTIPIVPTNISGFTNDAGYVTSSDIPTKTSELTNDSGFITSHQDISGKADKSEMSVTTSGDMTTITLKSGTSATVINQHQDISGKVNTSDLSTVATSGNYNDLSNKPIIPDELSDLSDDSTHRLVTDTEKSTWNAKQSALTFDSTPTANSTNPVTSAGIKAYVDNATPTLTMDDTPTSGSNNAVKSSGIYNALQGKQNTLTFDSTPTASSTNPVTSGGVKNALDLKANQSTTYTKTEVDGLLEDVAILADDDGQATTLDFDPQADTVWNKAQTLGSAQQAQARNNIGAVGSVTVNGSTYTPTNGNVDLGTISGGGGSVTVDSSLSTSSTNPVQNSVITTALNGKVGSSTITTIVSLTEAAYTALATKDASTLYVIVES